MKIEGQLIKCDYPNCEEQVMRAKIGEGETDGGYTKYNKYEPKPEGWGYVDGKDLCPDHYQYYLDMIAEFWEPPAQEEPKHASGVMLHLTNGTVLDEDYNVISTEEADQLMEEALQPTEPLEPIKDEDILYTNMPEMNSVKVTGPSGTVEGHVQEDW